MSRDSIKIELDHMMEEADLDIEQRKFMSERLQRMLNARLLMLTVHASVPPTHCITAESTEAILEAFGKILSKAIMDSKCYRLEIDNDSNTVQLSIQLSRFV